MSKKRIICIIVILAVIIICILFIPRIAPFILVLLLIALVFYYVNHCAVRIINSQKAPFQNYGKIRNVDYLIIGDMIDLNSIVPSDKKYVQIKAPNRGLNASFEILKHTSSILDEDNGNVIFAVKRTQCENKFSVFDVPFLHTLTIKKYGIEKLALLSKFPFFVKPFSTLTLLFNVFNKNWKEIKCPNKEIIRFCDERSFKLKYYEY